MYLYSAVVSKGNNGTIIVNAQTDLGMQFKADNEVFMADEDDTMYWSNTFHTAMYDPVTYLPKTLTLYYYADYEYSTGKYQKDYFEFIENYSFDFKTPVKIVSPMV